MSAVENTPTDGEREALLNAEGWPIPAVVDIVMERWSNDNDTIRRGGGDWSWKGLAETAIQSLAQAGLLRRTEVPEPSGQRPSPADQIHALLDEMNEEGGRISYSDYCVLHGMVSQLGIVAEGEPSDAQVPSGDLAICGCHRDGSELVTCARHTALRGEPSDAQWIADIETLALAQAAGHARMLEIGEGIGGLGVRNRSMFEDMLAWQDSSGNDHADTVLRLVAALRPAGGVR